MKILRVINSLQAGGAESSLAGNVPLHIKNGYHTDILLLSDENSFFLNTLKEQNVKVYSLNAKNIYNPVLIFKLRKFIKKYDIVHAHLFPSIYWVAFAKILSSIKPRLVFTEHSTTNRRRNKKIFKYFDRFVYKQYDKIISISRATSEMLMSDLDIHKNIITVFDGINISLFRENFESFSKMNLLNINNNVKLIIQIASFRPAKDQNTVIKAMTHLPSDYYLVLVGDGERKEICKALAKRLKVSDRVIFLGTRNDIPEIINVADIVVLSSHYEGFGRAAVEGMAAGKPTIATNVPGLAEVVKGAGLLFKVGNTQELVSHIMQLTTDEVYCKSIANKCHKRAELYSIERMVEKYEKVYESLIS